MLWLNWIPTISNQPFFLEPRQNERKMQIDWLNGSHFFPCLERKDAGRPVLYTNDAVVPFFGEQLSFSGKEGCKQGALWKIKSGYTVWRRQHQTMSHTGVALWLNGKILGGTGHLQIGSERNEIALSIKATMSHLRAVRCICLFLLWSADRRSEVVWSRYVSNLHRGSWRPKALVFFFNIENYGGLLIGLVMLWDICVVHLMKRNLCKLVIECYVIYSNSAIDAQLMSITFHDISIFVQNILWKKKKLLHKTV